MDARQMLRVALLLLVLCATGVQQWAARSHWHSATAGAFGAVSAISGGDTREGAAAHECVWCQAAAHAVGAAPPAQAWLLSRHDAVSIFVPAAAFAAQSSSPSWAWQSRGPPAA
jgi:hypothetical protein